MEHKEQLSKIRLAKWLFIGYVVIGYLLPVIINWGLSMGLSMELIARYRELYWLYFRDVLNTLSCFLFIGGTWAMKPLLGKCEKKLFYYWIIVGISSICILIILRFEINYNLSLLLYTLLYMSGLVIILGLDQLKSSRKTKGFDALMQGYVILTIINTIDCTSNLFTDHIHEYFKNHDIYVMEVYYFIIGFVRFAVGIYLIVGFVKMFKSLRVSPFEESSTESNRFLSQTVVGVIGSVCVCALLTYVLISNINLINF